MRIKLNKDWSIEPSAPGVLLQHKGCQRFYNRIKHYAIVPYIVPFKACPNCHTNIPEEVKVLINTFIKMKGIASLNI